MANIKTKYNSTPPTLQDGQWTDLQVDSNGYLIVSDGGAVEGGSAAANDDTMTTVGGYDGTTSRILLTDSSGRLNVVGIGLPNDTAWDGVAASATVISLLKAIALNTAAP